MVANLSDAWALAHQNIEKAQRKQKTQYDKRSTKPKIKTGDRVMVLFPNEVKGKSWKLARPYFGPFTVISGWYVYSIISLALIYSACENKSYFIRNAEFPP